MPIRTLATAAFAVAAALCTAPALGGDAGSSDAHVALATEVFRELVEIDTTHDDGSTTVAAEAVARRLRAAGFAADDLFQGGAAATKGNLVARLRGTGGARPLLLLAHLDVVAANPEDWTLPPFRFTEQDGYYYGRGTSDDKSMAAIFVAILLTLAEEGYRGPRDIIVALTADEEGGPHNGVQWLLANHRDRIDAEFAINEGGSGGMRGGRYLYNAVQASEKVYQTFTLETTNAGGHSSLPRPDNAIYQLAAALSRIAQHRFPAELNEVSRAYFAGLADIETDPVASDLRAAIGGGADAATAIERLSATPAFNSRLRTTCVATQLEGGHAENALPQRARATINCRVLPGMPIESVEQALAAAIADPAVTITRVGEAIASPPSPLTPLVMDAIRAETAALFPGVPVLPTMSTGATDGLFLRNAGMPVYGVSGIFGDIDDVRAHGRDERIRIASFREGLEFLYRLTKRLAGG